jgi:quercetin dioxygenase-like cupin family protein
MVVSVPAMCTESGDALYLCHQIQGDEAKNALTLLNNLALEIEPPVNGTLSRTIHQDDRLKAVLFGFAAGQELSEHTASTQAIIHFLRGEVKVSGGQAMAA